MTSNDRERQRYIDNLDDLLTKYFFEAVNRLEKMPEGNVDRKMMFACMMKVAWSVGIKAVIEDEMSEVEMFKLHDAVKLGMAATLDDLIFQDENR